MRLLSGIAALTILCMSAVALVTDHLANIFLSPVRAVPSSRIHLIDDVIQGLKRAQDDRNAYLITGNPTYLTAYHSAAADVDVSMDRLVTEDHEVTTKLTHASDVRQFVHAKLAEIGKDLATATPVRVAPAPTPAADADLQRIQKLLDSLAQEETADITGAIESTRNRATFHRDLVIALAAINLLFLGGIAFCAIQIGKLYSLVTMCAWSKRVQYQDKWIPLEEYMRKRFGIRISHGISEEEYEKWATTEMTELTEAEENPDSAVTTRPPKAAA
ncbi:MAG TPA: CHASE3 domain-containing protein [Chthoniobacteraceae bacterium]|jgi:CHASE3 domain sensor protein|nr:CHASE3 domain-containing protein [Chthoniobacteraceae bacterium]